MIILFIVLILKVNLNRFDANVYIYILIMYKKKMAVHKVAMDFHKVTVFLHKMFFSYL